MSGASGDTSRDDNKRNQTANDEANGDGKTSTSGKNDSKKPGENCSEDKNKKKKVGTLSVLGGILGAMAFQQAQSSKKKK